MIRVENMSVFFGGVRALNKLSAEFVDPIVGVIGPNGAGKTTLLNVFSGFVRPQSGSLTAFGDDLLAMPPHRRARWGLRRSFQTEQVVDDLTVVDNIRAILDPLPLGRGTKDEQIAAAIAYVGLEGRETLLGETLNTFDRRKIELAKALVGKPKAILLDEPGAGLGAQEAEVLRDLIVGIPDRYSASVLLIDHDVELIAATCTSTVVLDFGTLIAQGPTADVLQDERVKAAYLGIDEEQA